ncbi:MAG: TIGR03936 family radical SAM-associated protein [Synergistaceae bacterium]|nr:TIGR03936 family radical SAM-associated protein [Synergistaceae bacterium]
MPRYRIFYEKRGPACFIPHIVLPTVLTRAANRASHSKNEDCGLMPIIFQMTEGFSPHAKMSFASELPVGVVALMEPVDIWLTGNLSDSEFKAWSDNMPTGFKLNDFTEIPDGSPSLNKSCPVSEYLLKSSTADRMDSVREALFKIAENKFIDCRDEGEFIRFTVNNSVVALGAIVRELITENAVQGWHELRIVRVRVGAQQ